MTERVVDHLEAVEVKEQHGQHVAASRAVFEGVAYNSRWLLKYVEQFIGRRVTAINAVGGGAKKTGQAERGDDPKDFTHSSLQ